MPTIPEPEKELLRGDGHKVTPYMSVLRPITLWTANVTGTPARESETIPFSGGAGFDFSLVGKHQTVLVHHTDGQPTDKLRVKTVSSGDGGVTGTLVCNGNGTYWTGGETLEFTLNYEIWGVFPFVSGDPGNPDFTKDWDQDGGIHYTDENELMNPVAIAGPHRAGFLGPNGEISFHVPVGSSYPVANGASIVSKSVSVYPSSGAFVLPEDAGFVEIVYDTPGQYIVTTIVEDSNGKIQETYRVHFVHVNDPASEHYPMSGFDVLTVTGDWNQGGWTASARFHRDASFDSIPDESLVVLWQDAWYGEDYNQGISGITVAPEIIIAGYTRDDRFAVDLATGGSADVNIASVNALLEHRMMFSISLESRDNPSDWWQFQNGQLTSARIVHHILRWHSTIMHVTDVFGISTDQDQRKAIDIEKATVYQMANQTVADYGVIARLVCDKAGRLHISQDITIEEDAYRASLPIVSDILKSETFGEIGISHTPVKQVAFVFFSGFNYDGSTATPLGSTAPSTWPSQFGPDEIMVERQVVRNQNQSNEMAGQILAKHNNPYKEVRVTFARNYLGVLEPAFEEWWTLSINVSDTVRRIVWVDKKMVCRQVTAKYDIGKGLVNVDVVYETEPDGVPGVPYKWPTDTPEVGGETPDIYDDWVPGDPFPPQAGDILVTGASIWRRVGEQAWVEEYGPNVQDVDVDQNTANLTNPLQKHLYACAVGGILHSVDGGDVWTLVPDIPEPPNTWADTPAPALSEIIFEQYETDLNRSDAHWFLANWQHPVTDAWRSWLLLIDYSIDEEGDFYWYPVGIDDSPDEIESWGSAFQVTTSGTVQLLSGGRHLITYRDQSSIEISQKIRLGQDDYTTPVSHGISASIFDVSCVDDKFIIRAGSNIYVGQVDVSNNITLGSAVAIPGISRGSGGTIWAAAMLGPTKAVIVHGYPASDGNAGVDNKGFGVAVVTISGLSASIGAWTYTETDYDIYYGSLSVIRGSDTDALVVFTRTTVDGEFLGSGPIYAKAVSASGTTPTFPSPAAEVADVESRTTSVCFNGGNAYTIAAEVYQTGYEPLAENDLYYFPIAYDGTVTVGAGVLIGTWSSGSNFILDMQYAGEDRADMAYRLNGATNIVAIRTGGSDLDRTVSLLCTVESRPGPYAIVAGEGMVMQQASSLAWPFYFCASTATDGLSLGFDIDKFDGSKIYLTIYDNSFNMSLQTYSTSTGENLTSRFIAESIDSDIAKRRRWVYPFCPLGIDAVFLHGRMVIGGVSYQVMYTDDNGLTLSPIEDGWVIDHCASMVQDRYGYIYAIRCSDVGSPLPPKIYELSESLNLVLKGTPTTLDYGINPRAVKPGLNGQLYLAASSPNDFMVIETVYPFNGAGYDITANHQTSRGVKAIAVL